MSKNNIAETVARRTILNWIYANMLILSASTFFEKHLELFGIICDYLSLRYYFFQIRYIYICLIVKRITAYVVFVATFQDEFIIE